MIESLHPSVVESLSNDKPIVMLNLMKFREASLDGEGSGWDAYLRYSRLAGDVVSALLNLGYKRGEAEQAVQQVRADTTETLTVEVFLKDALKQLGR